MRIREAKRKGLKGETKLNDGIVAEDNSDILDTYEMMETEPMEEIEEDGDIDGYEGDDEAMENTRINAEVRDNTLQARRDGLVSGWELTKREQRKHRRQGKRVKWGE